MMKEEQDDKEYKLPLLSLAQRTKMGLITLLSLQFVLSGGLTVKT